MAGKPVRAANPEWFVTGLPQGLIMDILSRIPVKSLFNCKSVCKTWFHLISDPYFLKLQLKNSPSAILILDTLCDRREKIFATQITEVNNRNGFDFEDLMFVVNRNLPDVELRFANSCHGLVCLCKLSAEKFNETVYVCNPILGEYITISAISTIEKRRAQSFALGFSSMTEEYKVLQTFFVGKNFTYPFAEVYTIGTGRWRSVGNVFSGLGNLAFNTYLHDSIHWIEDHYNHPQDIEFIYAFDFGSEQFRQFSLPLLCHLHYDIHELCVSYLGVLEGCLFLASNVCYICEEFDIWVMKEYGIKESWTKRFIIGSAPGFGHDLFYEPLMFLRSGEILVLMNREDVACYDPKRKRFRNTTISNQYISSPKVTLYNPSFVSLQDVAKGEQLEMLRTKLD